MISGTPIVITPKTTYTISAANTGGSTLIPTSTAPSTTVTTNIYKNGTLTTAVPSHAVGCINDTDLLVQNYINDMETSGENEPMGMVIYNAQGQSVSPTPLSFQLVSK